MRHDPVTSPDNKRMPSALGAEREQEMELKHTEANGEVVYLLWITQDDAPVRGNAGSYGSDAEDKAVEDAILARLRAGDTWAWAQVTVQARHNDGRIGEAHLGGCCYRDTAEFIAPGGYREDMKATARDDMKHAGGDQ